MSRFFIKDGMGFRQVPIDRLMTIGRGQHNDLVLAAPMASRRHAWVWRQGDQVIIEDLGSMHGTYVNQQRLVAPRFLNHDDVVWIGEAQLTFIGDYDSASAKTPPRGVPRLGAEQAFCPRCGAANGPQAWHCANCGYILNEAQALRQTTPAPVRPITPMEPVVVRPFPSAPPTSRPGTDRKVWILILLLAILAVILVTMVGALLVYVLG